MGTTARVALLGAAVALVAGCNWVAPYASQSASDGGGRDVTADDGDRVDGRQPTDSDDRDGDDRDGDDRDGDDRDSRGRDATIDSTPRDATVDSTPPDSTVDAATRDSTVDGTPPDSTVDSTPPDSTVDSTPPDSTVDSTPPADSTVDSAPPADSTVDGTVDTAPANDTTPNRDTSAPKLLILGAVADIYVDQNAPNTNFSADDFFAVASANSRAKRSMLRFDFSSIPTSATVNKATLTLCADSNPDTPSAVFEMFMVTGSWSETSVTWQTQPNVQQLSVITFVGPTQDDECIDINVTAHVAAWVAGTNSNFGWGIKNRDPNNKDVEFSSRENSSQASQPKLVVQYTP